MRVLARIVVPRNGGLLAAAAVPSPGVFSLAQPAHEYIRWSSSTSRWKQRQSGDPYTREAKLRDLKSRAAFKLFGGYAPGSWSQVAYERTKPKGRVVGIDIIPAQPPKGVSTIQGNFLSPGVRQLVKDYLVEFADRRNPSESDVENSEEGMITDRPSYIDTERAESVESSHEDLSRNGERLVDVVLSDMSEPWPQISGFSVKTLAHAYIRMMNTSGMSFRDHAGSIDLCLAALQFASDTLKAGGHFVCKFYQGSEDKDLELKLKKMFEKVHREKPDASRSDSREAYFVALRRRDKVTIESIENR
ncbi:FtsJ-like methyltransferase [Daldinia bambusicola]|nr:FtsJ-like methyltransferase [Daldinia bambusicola]